MDAHVSRSGFPLPRAHCPYCDLDITELTYTIRHLRVTATWRVTTGKHKCPMCGFFTGVHVSHHGSREKYVHRHHPHG
jgi:hypothetical protein